MEHLLFPLLITLSLLFGFINGYHDGSNVVATTILSRSIEPRKALLFVSMAELAGALLFGSAVAHAIGSELLDPLFFHPARRLASSLVLFSVLGGTITWSVMTWWVGMPPSSSHCLMGGLMGAAMAAMGLDMINWSLLLKLGIILLAAPLAGALGGRLATSVFPTPRGDGAGGGESLFRRSQWLSLFLIGASHGTNNAQKAMALTTMALVLSGSLRVFEIPWWVFLGCGGCLALGVYVGGWNIVRVLGNRIFRITPSHAFLSQAVSGSIMLVSSICGSPVSAVEVIKSSVIGVGAGKRARNVHWMAFRDMLLAWLVTLPATALLAASIYWIASGALGEGMGSFESIMRSLGQ
ncbi:MAG: inorganic phosphate transporter [Deltaproteobacteria bacterium]|nr:inorganic phosphate transporter [Deltaproteobacteria bacterium]